MHGAFFHRHNNHHIHSQTDAWATNTPCNVLAINDHDELFLSTEGKYNDLWDTIINIAVLWKPIFFKISGDTLHILADKPEWFRPELTDAKICYHWREGNPLCYKEQARSNGYKIIHSLWTIDDYNQ